MLARSSSTPCLFYALKDLGGHNSLAALKAFSSGRLAPCGSNYVLQLGHAGD